MKQSILKELESLQKEKTKIYDNKDELIIKLKITDKEIEAKDIVITEIIMKEFLADNMFKKIFWMKSEYKLTVYIPKLQKSIRKLIYYLPDTLEYKDYHIYKVQDFLYVNSIDCSIEELIDNYNLHIDYPVDF